ncbi:TPA: PAAR domain-containing protein [Klebsiella pneumoniae]
MALEGYFLFQGDRTVCGGKIITGAEDTEFFGRSQARESDKVTCGKHPGSTVFVVAWATCTK